MRKILTLVLLAIFGLPLVSPLLALGQTTETAVHACCRRAGAHRCQASMVAPGEGTRLNAPLTQCPYSPRSVVPANVDLVGFGRSTYDLAPLASHPAGVAQTQSRLRIARERTRQKRGPPAARSL